MLDIKFIRENIDKVKEGCQNKKAKVDIDLLLKLDEKRKEALISLEGLRAKKNKATKEIVQSKTKTEKQKIVSAMKKIDKKEEVLQEKFNKLENDFNDLMLKVPNLPSKEVPLGNDQTGNVVLREVGEKTKFDFKIKDYFEIAKTFDLIDTERAAKISGTRFGFIKNEAVFLQFALIKFTLDILIKKGFLPILPPVMLSPEMMKGTGHLSEKDSEEKYFIEKDKLYLTGSAEQPLVSMHSGEVFQEKDLPKRYVGYSTCFRREAGSYGKDTKGIFRVHQFDKIEMFSFCLPEKSEEEHKNLLSIQEELMGLLKIPYRVVQICTGDLGFPAAAAYDIEAWLPSENRYRETHTTFNDTDFQARRLNIRFRNSKNNRLEIVHALNGTAFALGRILIAIIENNQQKDGSIKVPEALWEYLNFKEIR
ncbi:MAG: serine--tRNA ligase [Candidatus Nealsonbacteria bacterium]|nr:serine--tRNA ligase [Candidatus Nealsonbacteria bacterium]